MDLSRLFAVGKRDPRKEGPFLDGEAARSLGAACDVVDVLQADSLPSSGLGGEEALAAPADRRRVHGIAALSEFEKKKTE